MTTVTFDDAALALRTVIGASVGGYPVSYENEGKQAGIPPEPPAPWLRVQFRHVVGEQESIGAPGNNFHEDEGAVVVDVLVPVNDGDQIARQICDQVVALFRGKTFDAVEIRAIHGDAAGTIEDGNWWCRWRRIEFLIRSTA